MLRVQKILILNKKLAEINNDSVISKCFKSLCQKFFEEALSLTGIDFKKRDGHNVLFSARLNDAARILFTLEKDSEDKLCVIIQDVLLTHQYHRSYSLKNLHALKTLNEHSDEVACCITQENLASFFPVSIIKIDPKDIAEEALLNDTDILFEKAFVYKDTFVELDDVQSNFIESHKLPLVIMGHPGTGKTLLIKRMIEKFIEKSMDDEMRIIYIAPNHLVEEMNTELEGVKLDARIQCLTYQAFLKKEISALKEAIFIRKEEISNFIEINFDKKRFTSLRDTVEDNKHEIQKKYNDKNIKSITGNSLLEKFVEQIHLEFSIISNFKDKDAYINAGVKETCFEKVFRDFLYGFYKKYRDFLKKSKFVDTSLSITIDRVKPVDNCIICVDESQLLTENALSFLTHVSNSRIVFTCDPRQNLSNNKPILDVLSELTKNNIIELKKIYRCPGPVVQLINNLSEIADIVNNGKTTKTEGLLVKKEQSERLGVDECPHQPASDIVIMNEQSQDTLCYLTVAELKKNVEAIQKNYLGKVRIAIITDKQFINEAKEIFSSSFENEKAKLYILTPLQAIGCEWDVIICYRPFDIDDIPTLNTYYEENKPIPGKVLTNQPKEKAAISQKLSYLNELVVAMSRCKQSLIIVNDPVEPHKTKEIMAAIFQGAEPQKALKLELETFTEEQIQENDLKVDEQLKKQMLEENNIEMPLISEDEKKKMMALINEVKKEVFSVVHVNAEASVTKFHTTLINQLKAFFKENSVEKPINIHLLLSPIKKFFKENLEGNHGKKQGRKSSPPKKGRTGKKSSRKDPLSELENISLLYLLALTASGQIFLGDLLNKNSYLYNKITSDDLFVCHEIKNYQVIPPYVKSKHCLASLLLSMKDVRKKDVRFYAAPKDSLLTIGHDIFYQIVKRERLNDDIPHDKSYLKSVVKPLDNPEKTVSIEYLLMQSHFPLLSLVFKKYSSFIDEFNIDALMTEPEPNEELSNFALICQTPQGVNFLLKEQAKENSVKKLKDYVISEDLIRMETLLNIENNIFKSLLKDPDGRLFLKDFFNPQYIKQPKCAMTKFDHRDDLEASFTNLAKLEISKNENNLPFIKECFDNMINAIQLKFKNNRLFNKNFYFFIKKLLDKNNEKYTKLVELLLKESSYLFLIKSQADSFKDEPFEVAVAVTYQNFNGTFNTFLEFVIMHKDLNTLKFLLEKGFSPNDQNTQEKNRSILYYAVSCHDEKRDFLPFIKVLLDHGADINCNEPKTVLCEAISKKDLKLVSYLLEQGANINIRNYEDSLTPLKQAVKDGLFDIIVCLLKNKHIDIDQYTELFRDYFGKIAEAISAGTHVHMNMNIFYCLVQYLYEKIIELNPSSQVSNSAKLRMVKEIETSGFISFEILKAYFKEIMESLNALKVKPQETSSKKLMILISNMSKIIRTLSCSDSSSIDSASRNITSKIYQINVLNMGSFLVSIDKENPTLADLEQEFIKQVAMQYYNFSDLSFKWIFAGKCPKKEAFLKAIGVGEGDCIQCIPIHELSKEQQIGHSP
jgi:hypothetical protein